MHYVVLVKVLVNHESDQSYDDIRQQATLLAGDELDYVLGQMIDYYDDSPQILKTFLTRKDGEKVQACRATEFEKFTEFVPEALMFDRYIEHYFMEKYGVDWVKVLEREIKEAVDEESGPYHCEYESDMQTWFVTMDVHI